MLLGKNGINVGLFFPLIIDYGRSRMQVPYRSSEADTEHFVFVPDLDHHKNYINDKIPTRILHSIISTNVGINDDDNIDSKDNQNRRRWETRSTIGTDESTGLFNLTQFIKIIQSGSKIKDLPNIVNLFRKDATYFVSNNVIPQNVAEDNGKDQFLLIEYFYAKPDYSHDIRKFSTSFLIKFITSFENQYKFDTNMPNVFRLPLFNKVSHSFKIEMFLFQFFLMLDTNKLNEYDKNPYIIDEYTEKLQPNLMQSNSNYEPIFNTFLNKIPPSEIPNLTTDKYNIHYQYINIVNTVQKFNKELDIMLTSAIEIFSLFEFKLPPNKINYVDYVKDVLVINNIVEYMDSKKKEFKYTTDISCIFYMIQYVSQYHAPFWNSNGINDMLIKCEHFTNFLYLLLSMTCLNELFEKDEIDDNEQQNYTQKVGGQSPPTKQNDFDTLRFNMFVIQFANLHNNFNDTFTNDSCKYAKSHKIDSINEYYRKNGTQNKVFIGPTEKFILLMLYKCIKKYREQYNETNKIEFIKMVFFAWLFIISSQTWNYNIGIILNYSINNQISDNNKKITTTNKSIDQLFKDYEQKIKNYNYDRGYLYFYNFVLEIIHFIGNKNNKYLIFELYHTINITNNTLYDKEYLQNLFDRLLEFYKKADESEITKKQTNDSKFPLLKFVIKHVYSKTTPSMLIDFLTKIKGYGVNIIPRSDINDNKYEYIGHFRKLFSDKIGDINKNTNFIPISSSINQ